eukprot:COSAG06_NODE_4213_length_4471_cov_2.922919_4_plen_70_part_00
MRLRATTTWTSSERLALFVSVSDRLRAPGGGGSLCAPRRRVGLVIVRGQAAASGEGDGVARCREIVALC